MNRTVLAGLTGLVSVPFNASPLVDDLVTRDLSIVAREHCERIEHVVQHIRSMARDSTTHLLDHDERAYL